MIDPRKALKYSLFSLLVISLFFLSIEAAQRIRYTMRFKSSYWLKYGFCDKPSYYEEMMRKGRLNMGVKEIHVALKGHDGYNKCVPGNNIPNESVNSFGFRGPEFSRAKEKGVYRIVVLGGSTTFGSGVDDAHTYPVLLEKYLNGAAGRHVEVINGGIPEAEIGEIYNLIHKDVIPLEPDAVIINSIANNFLSSPIAYKYDLTGKVNQFLLDKSLFYMTLREKIMVSTGRSIVSIYRASTWVMVKNFMKDKKFYTDLKNSYLKIIREAKANRIRVIILKEVGLFGNSGAKYRGVILDKSFEPVWDKVYSLLDEIGKEEGVVVVDSDKYFKNLQDAGPLFIDGLHLTNEGNDRLAKLTAERIRDYI